MTVVTDVSHPAWDSPRYGTGNPTTLGKWGMVDDLRVSCAERQVGTLSRGSGVGEGTESENPRGGVRAVARGGVSRLSVFEGRWAGKEGSREAEGPGSSLVSGQWRDSGESSH